MRHTYGSIGLALQNGAVELYNKTSDTDRLYSTFLALIFDWHTSGFFPFYPQNNLVRLVKLGVVTGHGLLHAN